MSRLIRRGGGDSAPVDGTATVELELNGNEAEGWGSSDAYIVVTHDGEKTEYKNSKSLQVSKGSEITIETIKGVDGWGDDLILQKIRVQIGNHEYSLGVEKIVDNEHVPFSKYVFEVNEDMTVSMQFDTGRPNNFVEIVNYSNETLRLPGGHSVSPGITKINGVDGSGDRWFMIMFDAEGQIPLIDFDNEGVGDGLTRYHDLDHQHLEFMLHGYENNVVIYIIEPEELATSEKTEIQVGESIDLKLHERLDWMWNYNVAHIDSESEDDSIADVAVSSNDDHQIVSVKGVSASEQTCTITVTLHYHSSESGARFSTSLEMRVVDVPHPITVNKVGNGDVSVSPNPATKGQTITLTVKPEDGHCLDGISIDPEIGYTADGNVYTFVMPDQDVTVTVTFVPVTYTVTFYNGENVHDTLTFDHGNPLEFPETDPVRESDAEYEYKFSGWVDAAGNRVEDGTSVVGDMDLYASYEPSVRLYDIVFIAGNQVFSSELPYGAPIVPPADPVMDGYDFIGWDRYSPGMTVTGNATFYAIFEKVMEPIPPYDPGDEDMWIPPNIIYEDDDEEDPWISVVLGCTALLLFLLFFRYERRE